MSGPNWSKTLYIELSRQDIARFKFLLEAYDNLAVFSVIDRFRAVGKIFFAPEQEQDVRHVLSVLHASVPFSILPGGKPCKD